MRTYAVPFSFIASLIPSTIPSYPVQRHRFPAITSRAVCVRSSSGCFRSQHAVITTPGVHAPHCVAPDASIAPSDSGGMDSIVSIARPRA